MEFPYITPSEDLDTEEDSYAEKKGTHNCVLEHPRGPLAKEVFVGDVPKLIDYLREGSFTRTPRNCELAKKVLTKLEVQFSDESLEPEMTSK